MSDQLLSILIKAQDQASGTLKRVSKTMGDVTNNAATLAKDGFKKIAGAAQAMTSALMVGIPIITGLVAGIAIKAGQAQAEVQSMGVALETAMGGNIALAKEAQKNITDFAAKTPYELGEVMGAFIKLKNMGLDPSNEALTAYGDTASAMGKSLNDMVEAVADAATGEFERLKEFGIRSESQGNKVKFTFKGVTTEVAKNSKDIEKYLINLGKTNFAGGMEKQSKTLAGLFSTLSDTVNLKLAEAFDKLGGTDAATQLFDTLITTIGSVDIEAIITQLTLLQSKAQEVFTKFQTEYYPIIKPILDNIADVFMKSVVPAVQQLWDEIQKLINMPEFKVFMEAVAFILGVVIVAAIYFLIAAITILVNMFTTLVKQGQNLVVYFNEMGGNIQKIFAGIIQFITGVFSGDWEKAWNGIKTIFSGVWDSIKSTGKLALNGIIDSINGVINGFNSISGAVGGGKLNTIQGFASGTMYAPGGVALVGENGPELVNLPRGSQVRTATATADIMQGGGSVSIGNISIGMYAGTERDKRRIAEELGDAIESVLKQRKVV